MNAVLFGRSVEMIRYLLNQPGTDVNQRNDSNYAAIHYVRDLEVYHLLLEHGAEIEPLPSGQTMLIRVVANGGSIELIKHFLEQDDVNALDNCSSPAIHYAKTPEVYQLLVDHGADPFLMGRSKYTALMVALSYKFDDSMIKFWLEQGHDINAKDIWQKPVLSWVRKPNHWDILIEAGADWTVECDGSNILMYYVQKKRSPKLIRRVLEHGLFDINQGNQWGSPVLLHATSREIYELLVESGADESLVSDNKTNCLINAVDLGHEELVHYLLRTGKCDINAKNSNGVSAIQLVKTVEMFNMLFRHGADLSVLADDDDKPLLTALADKNVSVNVLRALLDKNASDVNETNKYGSPALHYVKSLKAYQLLVERGARVIRAQNGATCLMNIVSRNGPLDLIRHVCENVDVLEQDNNGLATIHYVGSADAYDVLVEHGVDVRVKDRNGMDILLKVVQLRRGLGLIKHLVKMGHDIHVVNRQGQNVLHYETRLPVFTWFLEQGVVASKNVWQSKLSQGIEWVKLWVKYGDLDEKFTQGMTALHYVQDQECYEFLVQQGLDPWANSAIGASVLLWRVYNGVTMDYLKFLLGRGYDVQQIDQNGMSVLHCAKDLDVYKLLLEHGADETGLTNSGNNVLMSVVGRSCNTKLTSYLLNQDKFDLEETNNLGKTALLLATNADQVRLLCAHGADIYVQANDRRNRWLLSNVEPIKMVLLEYGFTRWHLASDMEIVKKYLQKHKKVWHRSIWSWILLMARLRFCSASSMPSRWR